MLARFTLRFVAALQAFLLLTSLVIPGLISASTPPSLSATLSGETVTITGLDFGASDVVDLTTTAPDGSTIDTGSANADANGAFTYTFSLVSPAGGTYTAHAASQTSGASASATFDGPAAPTPSEPAPTPTDTPPTPTDAPPTPTDAPPTPTDTPPTPTPHPAPHPTPSA